MLANPRYRLLTLMAQHEPMSLDQIPLFAMLKGKLGYETQRQKLIAQNVANADTPGYAPVDLKPFEVGQSMKGTAARAISPGAIRVTDAAHLAPSDMGNANGTQGFDRTVARDSEVRLDGNHVVLEDQMMKMTEARMNYDAAIGFYQQSLQMLRTAAREPGK